MNPKLKGRKIPFRKDIFLAKLYKICPTLMINAASEQIRNITVMNNTVILEVVPKEEKPR